MKNLCPVETLYSDVQRPERNTCSVSTGSFCRVSKRNEDNAGGVVLRRRYANTSVPTPSPLWCRFLKAAWQDTILPGNMQANAWIWPAVMHSLVGTVRIANLIEKKSTSYKYWKTLEFSIYRVEILLLYILQYSFVIKHKIKRWKINSQFHFHLLIRNNIVVLRLGITILRHESFSTFNYISDRVFMRYHILIQDISSSFRKFN